MTQSAELTMFYQAYWDWLQRGAPNGSPFTRNRGLCENLSHWCDTNGYDAYAAEQELIKQFRTAGLNMGYPFGMDNYDKREDARTQHLDPARIEWVRSHMNGDNNG